MEAAILATRQIFEAIVGCTATIMFAFLPLMMIGGTSGQFIRVLPTAVLVTVGASLLVALTIIPFLASRVLRAEGEHGDGGFADRKGRSCHYRRQQTLKTLACVG